MARNALINYHASSSYSLPPFGLRLAKKEIGGDLRVIVRQVYLNGSSTSDRGFCSALLQVEPPNLESNRTRGYARLREDQEAGTYTIMTPAFVNFVLKPPRDLGNAHSRAAPRLAYGSTSRTTTILQTTVCTPILLPSSNPRAWESQELSMNLPRVALSYP